MEPGRLPPALRRPGRPHQIQGIGANFIPAVLDRSLLDEVVRVTDEQAFQTGRELAKHFGLLVGISSGAAVWAARQLCAREEFRDKTVVAVLPDSGDRYFSSPMFAQE